MLYLQKYLTNFLKVFFGSKKRNLAIVVENFKGKDILVIAIATLQLLQNPENVKISIFPFYTVPAEMLYLQKYLTNFHKIFFGLKKRNLAIVVENLKWHRYFGFAIATLQLFQHPENVKISIFPLTLSQQKCYISTSI